MPSTLDLCEQYYGTRDIYKLLEINKDSPEKDIKKAYYKLSLQVHPDRVKDDEKEVATEKFKILTKLHGLLTDKDKKNLYDEQGIIDDDGDADLSNSAWLEMWRQFFKPITTTDIDNYQKEYKGSEIEKTDIRKAYLNGKGCINYMMECVPFMAVEDEPRIIELVKGWIAAEDVPEYKIFINEPKVKRSRRHKKYAREALEARELKKEMEQKNSDNSLEQQIMRRQANRAESSNNFFDRLMAKYGGADDSEEYVLPTKKSKKSKSTKSSANTSMKNDDAKPSDRRVREGRVNKSKS